VLLCQPFFTDVVFPCTYLSCALQVKSVLQQLTAMNPNPTIGLAEAAEMLCKHLGVALVRYRHCSLMQTTAGLHGYCQAVPLFSGFCAAAGENPMCHQ
jgi:hypothetical protein